MAGKYVFQLSLLLFVSRTLSAPLNVDGSESSESVSLSPLLSGIGAAAALVLLVTVVVGCVCCRSQGFKSFPEHNGIQLPQRGSSRGNAEGLQADSEFTIFPPASAKFPLTAVNGDLEQVTFEPLPDITPRSRAPYERPLPSGHLPRPAHFKASVTHGLSLHDWFSPPHGGNFPRSRLQYLKELGVGWYGQSVEGEAQQIRPDERKTKVVVKILREDASPSEHMYFLHEVRQFRDLSHPNILQLVGQCLETDPFLVLLEHCQMNLKTYLINQRSSSDVLLQGGLLLEMVCQLTAGLQHMHSKGFIHTDLAARNCLLDNQLQVKIGDYGTSYSLFPEDYYCLGDIAFSIRWCAPETLLCIENSLETKDVTQEANLWSFGITLWEIMELGKQPYMELSDKQVLHQVVEHQQTKLEEPKTACLHRTLLFQVMQLCWGPPETRPSIGKVQALLNHLRQNKEMPPSQAFEERWHTLQQQSFNPRQHNLQYVTHSPESPPLVFESHFNPKSASLQNLRGSLEDMVLKQEQEEEEDKVQHQITLAIQELDDYLASEVTSSEVSSDRASPEQKRNVDWPYQKSSEEESDGDSAILCSSIAPADINADGGRGADSVGQTSVEDSPASVDYKDRGFEYVSRRDVNSPPSPPPSPSMRCGNLGCFSSGSTNSDVCQTMAFCPAHTLTLLDTPPITPDGFSSCTSPCNSRCLPSPCIEAVQPDPVHRHHGGKLPDAFPHDIPSKAELYDVRLIQDTVPLRSGEFCNIVKTLQSDKDCKARIDSVTKLDDNFVADLSGKVLSENCQGTLRLDSELETHLLNTMNDLSLLASEDVKVDPQGSVVQEHQLVFEDKEPSQSLEMPKTEIIEDLIKVDIEDQCSSNLKIEKERDSNDPVGLVFQNKVTDFSDLVPSNNIPLLHLDDESSVSPQMEKPFDSILNLCDLKSNVSENEEIGFSKTTNGLLKDNCLNQRINLDWCAANNLDSEVKDIILSFKHENANGLIIDDSNKMFGISDDKQLLTSGKRSRSENLMFLDKKIAEMVEDLLLSCIKIACTPPAVKSVFTIETDYSDNITKTCNLPLLSSNVEDNMPVYNIVKKSLASDIISNDDQYIVLSDEVKVNEGCNVVPKYDLYSNVNNMLNFNSYDVSQAVDLKGSINNLICQPESRLDDDLMSDIPIKVITSELVCQTPELDKLEAKELFVEDDSCADSQYEIYDILSGLEQDEHYSPVSDESGRKSAEDCTLFLEDLETGNREPIRCCGNSDELLDDELLIVDVETNEAMMLDPILRTFHEEPLYNDYLQMDCYHPSRLECIMEESDDASHAYNDDSELSTHYSQSIPGHLVHSVPPELVFEGDEVLAGNNEDTDEDEDSSFDSEEMEDEEEDDDDEGEEPNEEFHFKIASPYSDSRPEDAYTPDFDSDTDDTSSSTGTSRTSSSGSFVCPAASAQSPVKVFSSTWDSTMTPTKSAIKSPENKCYEKEERVPCVVGEMKKSVSFHEDDPMVVFSYPPVESDDDSEGNEDVAAEEFTFQIDYTNYADWEFQWQEGDIPEEEIEVTEDDLSEARPLCSTPQGNLGTIDLNTMMYSLCCEDMLDSLDSQGSLPSTSDASLNTKPFNFLSPARSTSSNGTTANATGISEYQTCLENQTGFVNLHASEIKYTGITDSSSDPFQSFYESGEDSSAEKIVDVTLNPETKTSEESTKFQMEYMNDDMFSLVQPSGTLNSLSEMERVFENFHADLLTSEFDLPESDTKMERQINPVLNSNTETEEKLNSTVLCTEERELPGIGAEVNVKTPVSEILNSSQNEAVHSSSSVFSNVIEFGEIQNDTVILSLHDSQSTIEISSNKPCQSGNLNESDLSGTTLLNDPTNSSAHLSTDDDILHSNVDMIVPSCDGNDEKTNIDELKADIDGALSALGDITLTQLSLNVTANPCHEDKHSVETLEAESGISENPKVQDALANSQIQGLEDDDFAISTLPTASVIIEPAAEGFQGGLKLTSVEYVLPNEEEKQAEILHAPLLVPQNRCSDDVVEAVNPTLMVEEFWGT